LGSDLTLAVAVAHEHIQQQCLALRHLRDRWLGRSAATGGQYLVKQ
jgi:hypothetical protein